MSLSSFNYVDYVYLTSLFLFIVFKKSSKLYFTIKNKKDTNGAEVKIVLPKYV